MTSRLWAGVWIVLNKISDQHLYVYNYTNYKLNTSDNQEHNFYKLFFF